MATTWEALLKGQSGVRHLDDDWAQDAPVKIGGPDRRRADRGARAGQGPPARPFLAVRDGRGDGGLGGLRAGGRRDRPRAARRRDGLGHRWRDDAAGQLRHPAREGPASGLAARRTDADAERPRPPQISLYVGAPRRRCNTPVSACASGNEAIALGLDQIRLGRADIVLAGGTEAAIHPLPMAAFANMMALSKNTGDPTTVSRPWDTARDGFVLGEGAGVLVLESEEHAKARGATIYAEVLGAGITADAHDIAQPDPAGRGGGAGDRAGAGGVRHRALRHRPHQRPRDLDAAGRHRRGPDDPRHARRPRRRGRGHQHQVDDRPPARRRRCPRRRSPRCWRSTTGSARPRSTSTTRILEVELDIPTSGARPARRATSRR